MVDESQCPNIERCELFPRLQGGVLGYCLNTYCYGDFSSCARHRYAKQHGRPPPITLLPNGGGSHDSPAR